MGETKAPRLATLRAIERALEEARPFCVWEEASYFVDDLPRKHTIEEYYALPSDKRVELIDGTFYDLTAPSTKHQEVVQELFFQLESQIRANKGKCKVFIAPLDVHVLKDSHNMFQPDVSVVCDREKITEQGIEGAPDLVMEVLSPSTRKRDMTMKLVRYQMAGVREYWLIDIDKEMVYVYDDLQESVITSIYNFEDTIPIAIYEGRFTICLEDMILYGQK